jgi:hypothetical protein
MTEQATTATETNVPTTTEAPAPAPVVTEVASPAIDYSALTLPDSISAELPLIADIRKIAADHKLPLEAAQSLVDGLGRDAKAAGEAAEKASAAEWATTLAGWQTEQKAHPELGGQNYDASRAAVATFLDTVGGPELRAWLKETNAGEHPLMFAAMAKAGKLLGESPLLRTSGDVPINPLRALYPTMYS